MIEKSLNERMHSLGIAEGSSNTIHFSVTLDEVQKRRGELVGKNGVEGRQTEGIKNRGHTEVQ